MGEGWKHSCGDPTLTGKKVNTVLKSNWVLKIKSLRAGDWAMVVGIAVYFAYFSYLLVIGLTKFIWGVWI